MKTKTVRTVWEVCSEWNVLSTWEKEEEANIVLRDYQKKYPEAQFYVSALSIQAIKEK